MNFEVTENNAVGIFNSLECLVNNPFIFRVNSVRLRRRKLHSVSDQLFLEFGQSVTDDDGRY